MKLARRSKSAVPFLNISRRAMIYCALGDQRSLQVQRHMTIDIFVQQIPELTGAARVAGLWAKGP